MKTPINFKSLNEVGKQNTLRNVKRDIRRRENTPKDCHATCMVITGFQLGEAIVDSRQEWNEILITADTLTNQGETKMEYSWTFLEQVELKIYLFVSDGKFSNSS